MEIDASKIDEAVIISMSVEHGYPRIYGQRLKDMRGSDHGGQIMAQRHPQLSGRALKLVRSYFTYQWR